MKYKNITKGPLKFRANNSKGEKQVFNLKPGKEMESDRKVSLSGLELIQNKKEKGDK